MRGSVRAKIRASSNHEVLKAESTADIVLILCDEILLGSY